MGKHLLIIVIAVITLGYVIVDDLILNRTNAIECCANGFDPTPFETTPVRP